MFLAGLRKTETLANFKHAFDFELTLRNDYARSDAVTNIVYQTTNQIDDLEQNLDEVEHRDTNYDVIEEDISLPGVFQSKFHQKNQKIYLKNELLENAEEISTMSSDDVTITSTSDIFQSSNGTSASFVNSSSHIEDSRSLKSSF